MCSIRKSMTKNYDVIIIGAGMGGLSAGVYLSKKGYKTLILEQQHYPGGYSSSFRRGGFSFDSAAHVVGSYNKGYSFRKLIERLDIEVDLIRVSPTDRMHFMDNPVIEIPIDYVEYKECLKNRFRKEAKNIDRFFDRLYKMTNPLYATTLIKKYSAFTYQQYLDLFFKDVKLQGILSSYSGFIGLPPKKVAALSALFTLKMFIIEGAYYPRGGGQSLPDAFVARFKENEGEILFNNKVTRILTDGNRVRGIKMKSGKVYNADIVISNIDCKSTYLELLNPEKICIGEAVKRKLMNYRISMSCFMIYLGTTDKVNTDKKNGWYYPSYDINECFNDSIYLHIPTNYDMSVSPPNTKIIMLAVPYSKERSGNEDWKAIKRELTDFYMEKLKRMIPNISANIIVMDAATPHTLERYTKNTLGAAYGWEQVPDQMYPNAFPSTSAVKGLFLTGHWTFPGGGVVSAALSGINTARQIVKEVNSALKDQVYQI